MNIINGEAPKKFIAQMRTAFNGKETIDATQASEWIYNRRVASRENPSQLDWLNQLVKTGIDETGHITNALYMDLLSDAFNPEQMGRFLRSYYWGSGYGFQRVVLKAAIKAHEHPVWKDYIMDIIHEENTPSSHCDIFRKFIFDQGYDVGTITPSASEFNAKMVKGYSSRLDYAFGYALGIETEADYQISLLAIAYTRKFSAALALTDFFEIHMSETGEEEHAKETCRAIESLVTADNNFLPENVILGFKQSILDTKEYVLKIREEVFMADQKISPKIVAGLSQILINVAELKSDFVVLPEHTLKGDLGIDSLSLIDVVFAVEKEFGIELSEAATASSKTVYELMSEVEKSITVQ